ncbi:MAG: DUF2283 domain-containing protein [Nanoarchaeota archaeon]
MQKFNFDYDSGNDDLFLHSPGSKSKGSVEFGNIIFDFDSQKRLVGIQLVNASKTLQDMVDENSVDNMKDFLESLNDCRVDIKDNSNMLIVRFLLASKIHELKPILSVPKIAEGSAALAYT